MAASSQAVSRTQATTIPSAITNHGQDLCATGLGASEARTRSVPHGSSRREMLRVFGKVRGRGWSGSQTPGCFSAMRRVFQKSSRSPLRSKSIRKVGWAKRVIAVMRRRTGCRVCRMSARASRSASRTCVPFGHCGSSVTYSSRACGKTGKRHSQEAAAAETAAVKKVNVFAPASKPAQAVASRMVEAALKTAKNSQNVLKI